LLLPEVLDMTAAGSLAQSFLSHRGSELEVDASNVQRLGAQCAQVLLSAVATWRADGKRLALVKPSTEFVECGRLLGVDLDHDSIAREQST
jgi:chemotaxis protein CheX